MTFRCINCGKEIESDNRLKSGTTNRNHCPFCLWSVHVDMYREGDRLSSCGTKMKPIALTFKNTGPNKFVIDQKGELMIVHKCIKWGKVSINRIASDDKPDEILEVFENSLNMNKDQKDNLKSVGIKIAEEKD